MLIWDATAQTYIPVGAKARWGRQLLSDGDFPTYSTDDYAALRGLERRLAWRQWVVFGTGPYAFTADALAVDRQREIVTA